MISSQQNPIYFSSFVYLIFGIFTILNGIRILNNLDKVIPFPYWIAIKLCSIFKGKQGEIQKKKELLTPERLRRNAFYHLFVGILLSVAGVLQLAAIIIAK